jgi:ribosomal protein S18 acetylase RimI-like enzyme
LLYRPYSSEDFAALYAIEEVCFEGPLRFDRSYMRRLVESQEAATWIAEQDGRMTGFAIVEWAHEMGGSVAYIETLEVLPAERGKGVGGGLLERLEFSARAANAGLIWLHVDAGNAGAVQLYESQGYVCEGREEDYYGPDRSALVYAKNLNSLSAA